MKPLCLQEIKYVLTGMPPQRQCILDRLETLEYHNKSKYSAQDILEFNFTRFILNHTNKTFTIDTKRYPRSIDTYWSFKFLEVTKTHYVYEELFN